MEAVIKTEGLTRRYGSQIAVDALDLEVREGEIFGFLGPNGAGKSTTILMLLGLTEPSAGRSWVLGCDPVTEPLSIKRQVGYLPENVGFYEDLTASENLGFVARLNQISEGESRKRIDEALDRVGLADEGRKEVGNYSRGMRQRLGIAELLIKKPRLVFLDEPTLGLDPDGINSMLDTIVQLSEDQGITVLLSSHLLHQVQRICSRIGIMNRGRLVAEGALDELLKDPDRGEAGSLEDLYMRYFKGNKHADHPA